MIIEGFGLLGYTICSAKLDIALREIFVDAYFVRGMAERLMENFRSYDSMTSPRTWLPPALSKKIWDCFNAGKWFLASTMLKTWAIMIAGAV